MQGRNKMFSERYWLKETVENQVERGFKGRPDLKNTQKSENQCFTKLPFLTLIGKRVIRYEVQKQTVGSFPKS